MLQRPIPRPLGILPWRPWPNAKVTVAHSSVSGHLTKTTRTKCFPPSLPKVNLCHWQDVGTQNQPSSLTLQDPLLEIGLSGHVHVSKGLKQNTSGWRGNFCEAPLWGPYADRLLLIQKGVVGLVPHFWYGATEWCVLNIKHWHCLLSTMLLHPNHALDIRSGYRSRSVTQTSS